MTDSSRFIMLKNELVSCQSARKLQSAETCVDEQIIPFPGQVYTLLFTHNGRSEYCHFGPTYAQKQTCPLTLSSVQLSSSMNPALGDYWAECSFIKKLVF